MAPAPMNTAVPYQLLADAVLVLHFAVVVFVVGGLVIVVAGNGLGWRWVNAWWFRLAHLGAIAFVAVQAWLGEWCPLTTLESWLRVQASGAGYTKSFIEHWLQRVIFYEAPFWVFTLAYTGFGLLVLAAWWRFPPKRKKKGGRRGALLANEGQSHAGMNLTERPPDGAPASNPPNGT
jgi:hypothetical protein